MKKLMIFLALAAMVGLTSCKKESNVSVEFSKSVYVLLADAPLTVEMKTSEAVSSSLSVSVSVSGTAIKGEEYTLSAEKFDFASGTNKAAITISPLNNLESKEIVLTIGALPAGYELGATTSTVISVEKKEKIIYTFTAEKADLLDTYKMTVELTGATTGNNFTATSDIEVPFQLNAESTAVLGEDFEVVGGNMSIVVSAGTNKGYATLKALDNEFGEEKVAIFGIDGAALGERFIEGTVPSITVTVKGILKYSSLVGTWEFVEIPGLEEWEMWVEEMEDDPALMPTHVDGYQFTFALDDNGVLTFTPGSIPGDLDNLLRECTISYTAPVNPAIDYVQLGDYCTEEAYMWTAEFMQLTYFMMSSANRAFSADTESLGEAAVAMRFNSDGNLEFHLRDYDQPPFMENWWGDFDPDMFGFCYVMKRVE